MLRCSTNRAGFSGLVSALSLLSVCGVASAAPTIDGAVNSGEGWLLLTEVSNALPALGGSAINSDATGETSTFNWWDGLFSGGGQNVRFTDNRGDIIRIWYSIDDTNLYLAVGGPTVPFNRFQDFGAADSRRVNDQGDLFIAVDAAGEPASASRSANDGFAFRFAPNDRKAVDFKGWRPTCVIGVSFVDNGGGGGGYAEVNFFDSNTFLFAPQGNSLSSFAWDSTLHSARAYDTINGLVGEFEFKIPLSSLVAQGIIVPGSPLRLAAFTTQNFAGSDVYDSAPGVGNGIVHEQLGDNPGDPDWDAVNMLPLLGASDVGSNFGSSPSANFVAGAFPAEPGLRDGVNTIEEFLEFIPVPRPVIVCCGLADLVGGDGNPPCDGSVDGNDFQAFLNAFAAGEVLADLVGGDGNPPVDGSVDGNDFQAFLNAFAAGC